MSKTVAKILVIGFVILLIANGAIASATPWEPDQVQPADRLIRWAASSAGTPSVYPSSSVRVRLPLIGTAASSGRYATTCCRQCERLSANAISWQSPLPRREDPARVLRSAN